MVLVTLDTLRYDSLAAGPEAAMPLTRARLSGCAEFERFYAASPATQPTHATLFTALHPWQHGVSGNGLVLGEERQTVAESLREAGFRTSAVVSSFPLARRFGFAQGFDEYHDRFTHSMYATDNWQGTSGPEDRRFYSLAESVTAAAIGTLDRAAGAPRQFHWFHYFDPHHPYGDTAAGPTVSPLDVVREIVEGRAERQAGIARARRLYDRDVAYLDRSLDRLLERLDAERGRFETHLLITADHGESFGEDGSMFHGRRLTEGQIRAPLVVCSPRIAPGRRGDVAGSIDVPATLLSLAGMAGAAGGRDLVEGAGRPGGAFGMRNTFRGPARELRLDGRSYPLDGRLFYAVDAQGTLYRGHGEELLEPLRPGGGGIGATSDPERLMALFASFEARLERSGAAAAADEEARRALEALGYLD